MFQESIWESIKVGDKVNIEKTLSEHPLLLWFVHYAVFQEIWIWCLVLCFLGRGKRWALWEWGGVLNKERKDLRQRSNQQNNTQKNQEDQEDSTQQYLTIIFKGMTLSNVLFIHPIYCNDEQL